MAKDVVAAADFGVETEGGHCLLHNPQLPAHIVAAVRHDEGEIEVAAIVIDSTATGAATHQAAAVGLEAFHVAFSIGVLVATYHHRAIVAPKIHDHLTFFAMRKQIVLHCDVEIRVHAIADNDTVHIRLIV